MVEDLIAALDRLAPPALTKRQALERFVAHARLAVQRGVTVDAICDAMTECGIRLSPDQLRRYLAGETPRGRPPEAEALIRAAGLASGLAAPARKPGRPRKAEE
jgi:hypothetical protein